MKNSAGIRSTTPTATSALGTKNYDDDEEEQDRPGAQRATKVESSLPTCNKPTIEDPTCSYEEDGTRARYRIIPGDHIAHRYEILGLLSDGANGVVVKALDLFEDKREVAIKVIDFIDEGTLQLSEIESHVLTALHSTAKSRGLSRFNIVHLESAYIFRKHLCLSMELVDGQDLFEHICLSYKNGMPIPLIRHITRELVNALVLLDSASVIHGDMKLENVLFNPDTLAVKLIDFGNSFFDLGEDDNSWRTVACLCCRPPEAVLGVDIGSAVDMWGLGCMIVELLSVRSPFSADDESELLMLQQAFLGPLPNRLMQHSDRTSGFFNADGRQMHPRASRHPPGSCSLANYVRAGSHELDPELLSFVLQCLALDPSERMTPSGALQHPFLAAAYQSTLGFKEQCSSEISSRLARKSGNVQTVPTVYGRSLLCPAESFSLSHVSSDEHYRRISRQNLCLCNVSSCILVGANVPPGFQEGLQEARLAYQEPFLEETVSQPLKSAWL